MQLDSGSSQSRISFLELVPCNAMPEDLFAARERSFHEPKRLAIMSALIAATDQEMSFTALKEACDLTDGHLNRHLRALEEAGAVAFRRTSGLSRPQTIVSITAPGRRGFVDYLGALEEVLKRASTAAGRNRVTSTEVGGLRRQGVSP